MVDHIQAFLKTILLKPSGNAYMAVHKIGTHMKTHALMLGIILLCSATSAHHSGAAIDLTRTVTIAGTIKEFLWANPHCWFYVTVNKTDGSTEEWSIEGPPIAGLARTGMRSKTLKPGDKVEVTLSPRKDGKTGGGLMSIKVIETGQVYGTGLPFPGQATETTSATAPSGQ